MASYPNAFHLLGLILLIVGPAVVSVVLYQPLGFDPVPFPVGAASSAAAEPERRSGVVGSSERIGEGLLPGPEDLAFDAAEGFLYTGCDDGWVRRVGIAGDAAPAVEDWTFVGGRPLGIAFAPDGNLIVAESDKGLMVVKKDKAVELLTNQAEGIQFRLTDGVDVASDGIIYFTDASYKYNLDMHLLDILEGRPHGRLMSFDPSTNHTVVLLRDLFFANGVSISPDQQSLIYCETPLRRCRRYHIHGERKGAVDEFIDNLPGFPDNVRYDGEGHYWIALSVGRTFTWDIVMKYPFLRRLMVVVGKFAKFQPLQRDSGVLKMTLDGQPITLYYDPELYLVTGGVKIGSHLYYGSLHKSYISRINLSADANSM